MVCLFFLGVGAYVENCKQEGSSVTDCRALDDDKPFTEDTVGF